MDERRDEDAVRFWARNAAAPAAAAAPGERDGLELAGLVGWLARLGGAEQVVEITGSGGRTGLCLLAGMAGRSTLTSIVEQPAAQDEAARAFARAGVNDHVRLVRAAAETVLPRFADDSYDLVLLDGDVRAYPDHLVHVRRLLRVGGVLVASGVLPSDEDEQTTARARTFRAIVSDDPGFAAHLFLTAEGTLVAARVPE